MQRSASAEWMSGQAVALAGGEGPWIYRPYCYDIMVVVPQENAAAVDAYLCALIEARRLTFHEGKTDRVVFDTNIANRTSIALQYLGFTFDGVKVLFRISFLSRYYGKMRRGVRKLRNRSLTSCEIRDFAARESQSKRTVIKDRVDFAAAVQRRR